MAVPVVSEGHVQGILKGLGYSATANRTATGTLWKHRDTGKHIQVPDSLDGFYPDFILKDLEEIIGKVNPWVAFKAEQDKARYEAKEKKKRK